MATNTTAPTTAPRAEATERAIAWTTTLAPLATGGLAPFLNPDAALAAQLAYLGGASFMTANIMDWLPDDLTQHMPAGDIIAKHRMSLFISTLTAGIGLGMGTLVGPDGTLALLTGLLNPVTPEGVVSLGWWTANALIPLKFRKVFGRQKKQTAAPAAAVPPPPTHKPIPAENTPEWVVYQWGQHISDPAGGKHRGQELELLTYSDRRWQGIIKAPVGSSVTVTKETVSSVYQKDAAWITFRDGAHTGERHITVNRQAPAELDTTTLTGAWTKWAARTGGIMAGTHLEEIQPDPHTGGEVARVVADANRDSLPKPDMRELVGALRVDNPLLLSYEPGKNPRKATIRLMKENPLRDGIPFPGPEALLPSPGGYFRLGRAVSGRPVRAQLLDPKLGARHLIVTGVTGSGKGGVLQLIALAAHLAGAVIIYADPKGSSNPAIEKMAAYTGLGEDGAMGALLLMEALTEHRIEATGEIKQKNFDPTVMPHVVFILDEASTLLGEGAKYRTRAKTAVGLGAKKGRSLGISEVLANQLLQFAEIGDAAIRDNVVGSGGNIMLRSDSSQRHLIDLPPGMESVNPADIPRTWAGDDEDTLIYDDDTHIADPESTFGLGYFMTTDGVCAMGRTFDLEDATPYINPNGIQIPFDWPDWENRHEIVAARLAEAGGDTAGATAPTSPLTGGAPPAPAPKELSAKEKILAALQQFADPLGLDPVYVDKQTIRDHTALAGQTLDNALTQLKNDNAIHRPIRDGKEVTGKYALGPAPDGPAGE